jgi:glycosyltransferase involved in cell wall biosynthesis
MRKLGLMVRGDYGGISIQSRRLANFLKPERILYIDSRSFSKNKEQHPEWYDGFNGYKVDGFPTNREVIKFMQGLTHFLCIENPHNFLFFSLGKQKGIKTFCQTNYEFADNIRDPSLPLPDKFLMPSYWKLDEMKERFDAEYLPPPINPEEFSTARDINLNRKGNRFLHIVGTLAAEDRNGTLDLLKALKHTQSSFELIIRSQHPLPPEYMTDDHRVKYIIENTPETQDMYKDFDALILPRRYGGLSLPVQEALISGLPVLMPDISPNNQLLPKEWLFKARKKSELFTRMIIDVYESLDIAEKIDWLVNQDLKAQAFEIGYNEFAESSLKERYDKHFSTSQ